MPGRPVDGLALQRRGRTSVLGVVGLFAALAIAAFAWIYGTGLAAGPPIRSDAMGYYLYLPAVLVDRDVTLERTAERSFAGREDDMQGVRRVPPQGRYLDKFPVGEAIMLTPFFLLGHIGAFATGDERTGFSKPYQVAAAAGGLTFALLGLWFLGLLLLRWFTATTACITLVAIAFGTNLFHYATFDAVFSHACSFFLVALSVTLAVDLSEHPRVARAAGLGVSLGLLTAVRPTNAVLLVFVALVGVTDEKSLAARMRGLRRRPGLVGVGSLAFVLPIVPQLAYWYEITGRFFVYAYGDERLDLLRPHLFDVLFSVRKGLFFWSPLLVLAVVGLLWLRRSAPGLFIASAAFLTVDAWVVASWDTWWYGGSLGQRPFVEALPVFALGLAALVETARSRISRPIVLTATVLCSLLAIHATISYWLEAIPYDGTTWHVYVESFERLYG